MGELGAKVMEESLCVCVRAHVCVWKRCAQMKNMWRVEVLTNYKNNWGGGGTIGLLKQAWKSEERNYFSFL